MREGFIGLGHLVNFVTFADGVPLPLIGFKDFRGERGLHGLALAVVRKIHNPAERKGVLAVGGDFQRHLVRGAESG